MEFNTTEGEIGILPGHIPMTVIVKPGVLNITERESEKKAALHAGFAEILPEGVTILAEIIELPSRRRLTRIVPGPPGSAPRNGFRARRLTRILPRPRPPC